MVLSEQMIDILNKFSTEYGITIDWSDHSLSSYVEELMDKIVKYEIATSVAWICIMVCLTIGFFFISYILHKMAVKKYDEYDYDYAIAWFVTFSWIIFGCIAFASIFVIVHQIFDITTCLTLPEKYLYKVIQTYITNLN